VIEEYKQHFVTQFPERVFVTWMVIYISHAV